MPLQLQSIGCKGGSRGGARGHVPPQTVPILQGVAGELLGIGTGLIHFWALVPPPEINPGSATACFDSCSWIKQPCMFKMYNSIFVSV